MLVGVSIDQSIAEEANALLRGNQVEGAEMLIAGADSYDFFGRLDSPRIARIKSGDKSISIARLHHHHAEIISLKHFVARNL